MKCPSNGGETITEQIYAPLRVVPRQPWKKCPSTHCERREECASPNECIVKSERDK